MVDPTPSSVGFPVYDPNDKRPLVEIIAAHYGFPLAHVDLEGGKRFYAIQSWIRGVAQTPEPSGFWLKMKRRLKKIGIETWTWCPSLPYLASDGKTYQRDHTEATGLYQITQRMDANTGLRNQILQFLAKAGVFVDDIRIDPDKALEAALEAYRRQGKSEKWIETRIQSKIQRIRFTAAFRQAMKTNPSQLQYAVITDEMRMGLWKRNSATLRKQMDLKKNDNIRDHQSRLAIIYESLTEELSSVELEQKRGLEFGQIKGIVRKHSESVGIHAEQASRELGIDIATNRPLLPDETDKD